MEKTPLFDNLKDFQSATDPIRYWSWQDSSDISTRQVMQWHDINNSPADYLRADAYAGEADFSIIGKTYAHLSSMGAVEWCWPVQDAMRWCIGIDMHFIYPECQSRQVAELWQDDVLLWRRGFTADFPVAEYLFLDTRALEGDIRLLVISESEDMSLGTFVYRLKLYRGDFDSQAFALERKTRLSLPAKKQMFAGLEGLPPNLQRKLFEKECPTHHFTPEEKTALQLAVTAKALQQLGCAEKILGESGFFSVK